MDLTYASFLASRSRPVGLPCQTSGKARVLVLARVSSISSDPLGVFVGMCLFYVFFAAIKHESELDKLEVFDVLQSWLFLFSYLSVICCLPSMSRWLSWDFCGCPMRSRTHYWSFSFCRWLLCYVSVHVDLSFFAGGKEKKIKHGLLKCLVLFRRL